MFKKIFTNKKWSVDNILMNYSKFSIIYYVYIIVLYCELNTIETSIQLNLLICC